MIKKEKDSDNFGAPIKTGGEVPRREYREIENIRRRERHRHTFSNLKRSITENFFVAPTIGAWVSVGTMGGKNSGNNESANDGSTHGGAFSYVYNLPVHFGVLFGGIVGYGKSIGPTVGVASGVSVNPWLSSDFYGLQVGLHIKRKVNLGIVIPIHMTSNVVEAVGLGLIGFGVALGSSVYQYLKNR